MNNNINMIIEKVLGQLEIDRVDARKTDVQLQGEVYFVRFCTYWQYYEVYVDAESMEILGLNFEPSADKPSAHMEYLMAKIA